jgi:hypothetical protein
LTATTKSTVTIEINLPPSPRIAEASSSRHLSRTESVVPLGGKLCCDETGFDLLSESFLSDLLSEDSLLDFLDELLPESLLTGVGAVKISICNYFIIILNTVKLQSNIICTLISIKSS